MKEPQFINIPNPKVSYAFRIEEINLNKMHELANLLNLNTAELLNNIVNDYLKDKIVYNNYLENYKDYIIEIPNNLFFKLYLTNSITINYAESLNNMDYKKYYLKLWNDKLKAAEVDKEIKPDDIDQIIEPFKIWRIPNNLDTFNKELGLYCYQNNENIHAGIEFYINVDIVESLKDFTSCLYCFYFYLNNDDLTIRLVSLNKAKAYLKIQENIEVLNIVNKITNELKHAETKDEVIKIAETWNTGNIIKLIDYTEKVKPYKIQITEDNTIIKYHDEKLNKDIKQLKKEIKDQREINEALIEDLDDTIKDLDKVKKENEELKELNKDFLTKLNTAVESARIETEKTTREQIKRESQETLNKLLLKYGLINEDEIE